MSFSAVRSFPLSIISAALLLGIPSSAFPMLNGDAKIALHLSAQGAKNPCSNQPLSCNPNQPTLDTTGEAQTPYFLYILVMDGSSSAGVAGASFGIEYTQNLYVADWTLCADVEFTSGPGTTVWPQSGAGTAVTWNRSTNCQNTQAPGDSSGGVTTTIGLFYVYAYGDARFSITSRTYAGNEFAIADCQAQPSFPPFPNNAGSVGFGTMPGVDPCFDAPDTSDGKGMYALTYDPSTLIVRMSPDFLPLSRASLPLPTGLAEFPSDILPDLQRLGVVNAEQIFPEFRREIYDARGSLLTLPNDLSYYYRLTLATPSALTVKSELQEYPYFYSVDLNGRYAPMSPTDPEYAQQWWLHNLGQIPTTHRYDINAEAAWSICTGADNPVYVGVVDGGVELPHPDLEGTQGVTFVVSPATSDGYSGKGHGTAVAGIIGARTDNSLLGAGVNRGAVVVPIKVQASVGGATDDNIAAGISWATANGIPIINISLAKDDPSLVVTEALRNRAYAGFLTVAAAGNSNENARMYPAAHDDCVLTVGAVWADGHRWENTHINTLFSCGLSGGPGSNYGSWVDLVAPGGRSIATSAKSPYWFYGIEDEQGVVSPCIEGFSGTSAAAPVVAGVASLLESYRPGLYTGDDVAQMLELTAIDPTGAGEVLPNIYYGAGGVDASLALTYAANHGLQTGNIQLSVYSGPTQRILWVKDHWCYAQTGYDSWWVDEYELRGVVRFDPPFETPPDVWIKSHGSEGWRQGTHYYYEHSNSYGEVLAETVAVDSMVVRAYAYRFIARYGTGQGPMDPCRWQPGTLDEIRLGWSAMGQLTSTGFEGSPSVPRRVALVANPTTAARVRFRINVPATEVVDIRVVDIAGRLVRSLSLGRLDAGLHDVRWDGRSEGGAQLPVGVYLFKVRGETFEDSGKLVIVD